jgi:hypothetical protein
MNAATAVTDEGVGGGSGGNAAARSPRSVHEWGGVRGRQGGGVGQRHVRVPRSTNVATWMDTCGDGGNEGVGEG